MSVSPLTSLGEEHAAMSSLLALIQQEQAQLVVMDVDTLSDLTARKNLLVNRIAGLSAKRHQALAAAGCAAREDGMTAWLAQNAAGDAAALWSDLLAMTREAKELNRINGMLINKHLVHTQSALQALRPAAAGASTYGPSGQTMSGPSSHRVVIG